MFIKKKFWNFLFTFVFLVSGGVVGQTKDVPEINCTHDAKTFRCVEYVRNYDADTITFNIPGTHPLLGKNAQVRVFGIDTPEIRTKDKCEKKLAREGKYVVRRMLKKAKVIHLTNVKKGKYFRILADVLIDGVSLSKFLLKNNYGYRYLGKKKKAVNWCGFRMRPKKRIQVEQKW
tara:strand:+ start:190 stop:714 length:525 start_codon:yes stop_codon:yes gene_type:complete